MREYIAHIYESIIMRDAMQRDGIKELPQLTRDYNRNNYKGIQHINVLDWLLEK